MKRRIVVLACLFQMFCLYSQIDLPNGFQTIVNQDSIRTSCGEIKDGLPHGLWTNFYVNQNIKSKGFWRDGKLDSTWKFYTIDGKIEKLISYRDDLKNGIYQKFDSLEQLSFEGWYINDTLQGAFKTFENGSVQKKGNYTKGIRTGEIEEYDSLGNLSSIIELENGKEIQKRSIQTLVNGRPLIGFDSNRIQTNFIESNEKINRVQFKDQNGVLISEVVMLNDEKEGFELFFDQQQNVRFAKEWKNGVLLSEGKMDNLGYKDSVWTTYSGKSRVTSRISYKNGKKDGKCTYFFESGNIEQEGFYFNNELDGVWKWFYEDGTIRKEENYYKNLLEGDQMDYNEKGELVQKKSYSFQMIEGPVYYYFGDHQEKGTYKNGLRQGKWVYRFSNGKKEFIGKYKDGLAIGKHKYWYNNGRKKRIEKYKKGVLNGRRTNFSKNGRIEDQFYFKNGKLILVNERFVESRELIEK
ncbi:MAG: hypothetical protein KJ941_06740 [Bacteroidetes bacterium]|nr:hypothetical protein [Bacteroidota bacterium]